MDDLFAAAGDRQPMRIEPAKKLAGRVAGLYAAAGRDFETASRDWLDLTFEGIPGDLHGGSTRRAGPREPWYPRGTVLRNTRQLTLVAPDELALVAKRLDIASLSAEWLGANLLIDGIPHLSMLPPGTLLSFASGAVVKVDGQNAPCRRAGRKVAERAGLEDIRLGALRFVREARRLRGLVAWVEAPGAVVAGDSVSVRVPEQCIYRA
jgi:hypothetical protein